ncbi:MAG: MFS transporter [Phycisphaerae bacterium]|nr:MFS transporter [Phycisphaerae bacterium]
MEKKPLSFLEQVGSLSANFWYANFIEMFERLAFFGVRAIAALYLIRSASENGLGLTYVQKGDIYFWWALVQCLVPMVSGGYSDRYGYRKSLVVAFTLNIIGYLGMAQSKPIADYLATQGWENPGYWVFLAAALCVAMGTAIFKPPIQGTVAKSVTEETSSMGFGLFYWVVNIGGAVAPMGAAYLRHDVDWNYVFYAAAIVTLLNFLPTFLLYREPDKGEVDRSKGPFGVFFSSIANIFRDGRLVVFLLLSSCFWFMFMQLWDLLPNFIDEWTNTRDVAGIFGAISGGWLEPDGRAKPEMIININALSIVLLVVPISWLIRRLNKVAAMVIGMAISLVGGVGAGATHLGLICCAMIFLFSIGEMICSPTFGAYIGLIAPKEKKALYMGYSNIPFAVGWALGNKISGYLYQGISSKFCLARRYMADVVGLDASFVADESRLPNQRVMEVLTHALEHENAQVTQEKLTTAFAGVDLTGLSPEESASRATDIINSALNLPETTDTLAATRLLWDSYHPEMVWYYLGIVGLIGTIGMVWFYFAIKKKTAATVPST